MPDRLFRQDAPAGIVANRGDRTLMTHLSLSARSFSVPDMSDVVDPVRGASAFSSIEVASSPALVADAWDGLAQVAPVSPYQTRRWVEAWLATEGQAAGLTPAVVVARGQDGAPVALLPLGTRRERLGRRAIFLGGRHSNYNLGLFSHRATWTPPEALRLLRDAAAAIPGRIDLFEFIHQPESWAGAPNVLARLGYTQPSPSLGHSAVLQPDGESYLRAHQSAATRKKLRAKAGHLAALGTLRFGSPETSGEIAAVLEAHLEQKVAKLAALGIALPDVTALRRLFDQAAGLHANGGGPLELHALWCGDRIVSTFGGLAHQGRFSGLLISYDGTPAVARCSPGELLLSEVIKQKCAQGFTAFDLGIGEARYKQDLCPVDDALVDGFISLTVNGRLMMASEAARLRLKTAIKRSPPAWAAAQALRRAVAPVRARLRG